MTTTGDMTYGRQGGRLIDPGPSPLVPQAPTSTPWPRGGTTMRRHLVDAHHLDPATVVEHTPTEWNAWHAAEHRNLDPKAGKTRHAGHLTHTHPS